MLTARACTALNKDGGRCGAAALRDADLCFWHSPEHAEEAKEARRLGGLRRKREHAVAGAYDVEGLASVPHIRRVVEIVLTDALNMENSIARGRLLLAAAQTAAKLLEVGELEERITAVEQTLRPRLLKARGRR